MSYSKTLDFLYSLQKTGIKFGLENTFKLLEILGNPHKKYKTIHIAGTNGKGSTSTFIASILSNMNYKVGLYTSPHLLKFNERIKVDGREIEDEFIIQIVNELKNKILEVNPTFFEVTTVIAFKYFEEQNVDYAVIETGMGGRLDATNVIDPEISVITRIDFDHSEYLGDSINKIAFEKGGIIKENKPVIMGSNNEIVKRVIAEISKKKNSNCIFVDEHYLSEVMLKNLDELRVRVISDITGYEYQISSPLIGDYQVENIKNAIATFEILFPLQNLSEEISNGISKLKFPILGRFQLIKSTPQIILDTAHNSDAIKNFLRSLNSLIPNLKVAVFGIMKDKLIDDVIGLIENSFDRIYLCQARINRSLDVNLLAEKFSKTKIKKFSSVDLAIETAMKDINEKNFIVIFGSNYIVGEALEYLNDKEIFG